MAIQQGDRPSARHWNRTVLSGAVVVVVVGSLGTSVRQHEFQKTNIRDLAAESVRAVYSPLSPEITNFRIVRGSRAVGGVRRVGYSAFR
jgi:hypothetical protein